MTLKDRNRLRSLATEQMEFANRTDNVAKVDLWKKHIDGKAERPTIHIEVGTFANEVITPSMECEDDFARHIEYCLLHNIVNAKYFFDDKPVPPYFQINHNIDFKLFGHRIADTVIKNEDGTELGHHYDHIITDLESDFEKILSPSTFSVDTADTFKRKEILEEIFGDILPIKIVTPSLNCPPTQHVVHMMGMENMYCSMYDYPDLFKQMMDRIAEDYLKFYDFLDESKILTQNHSFEWLGQGSFCFYNEDETSAPVKTNQIWGSMDSQETVGISPEMFSEFIFPCYKKISERYGRLSYGCCESVHSFWKNIKTLPNLKKVSISPWCDEDFMANELMGSSIIYHRKPSPTFLGVGERLDEDAFRKHIDTTIKTARGCTLEIAQRDVYTINRDINKVKRYVEIIKESICDNW